MQPTLSRGLATVLTSATVIACAGAPRAPSPPLRFFAYETSAINWWPGIIAGRAFADSLSAHLPTGALDPLDRRDLLSYIGDPLESPGTLSVRDVRVLGKSFHAECIITIDLEAQNGQIVGRALLQPTDTLALARVLVVVTGSMRDRVLGMLAQRLAQDTSWRARQPVVP